MAMEKLLLLLFFLVPYSSGQSLFCLPSLTGCFCTSPGGNLEILCTTENISEVKAAIIENNLGTSLHKLSILINAETVLPANFVQDLPQLTELSFRQGALTTIMPGAFSNATNLQLLDLRNNRLTWLSGDMLNGVTSSLRQLRLDNNMISQLLSDLRPIFLLVSAQISLNGNNLNCSCQLQWLHNLLTSNMNLPSITGATCTDSVGTAISLSQQGLNFTKCLDLCSLGYYTCPANVTCFPSQNNESYACLSEPLPSPSPSFVLSPSPSFVLSPLPSLILTSSFLSLPSSLLTTELSSLILHSSSQSFYLSNSEYNSVSSSPFSSIISSEYSSVISSEYSSVVSSEYSSVVSLEYSSVVSSEYSSVVSSEYTSILSSVYSTSHDMSSYISPTSSSLIITPTPLCSNQYCLPDQTCMQLGCGCSKCLCAENLVQSSNNTCISLGTIPQCDTDESMGLLWPAVAYGTTVTLPCCSSLNSHCETVMRTCQSDGQWTPPIGPQCISQGTHNLQTLLNQAMSGDQVQLQTLAEDTLAHIMMSNSLLPGDIVTLSNLIAQTVNLVNNMTSLQAVQSIVYSVSELMSASHADAWQQVDSASIVTLFNAVENLGYAIQLENGSLTIATHNLALVVLSPSGDEKGWNFSSSLLKNYTGGQSSIQLPASIFDSILGDKTLAGCDVRIVVSMWDIDTGYLEVNDTTAPTQASLVHGQCDWGSSVSTISDTVVNSIIITASVYSSNCSLNRTRFVDPVRITLYHVNTTLDNPNCSFLDPEDNSGNQWLGEGCSVDMQSTNDYTICNCYHLTTFALLMSPTGATSVNRPLAIATKVGLSISITALIVTIILLFGLKIESKLNQVHRQLALSLCLSQITFLIGVDRSAVPSPDILCTAIAGLLHYLLLCTFAWQLVEGIHLYLFVVKVFYNSKIVYAYYPLAWGIPLFIVAITMGIDFCDYGSLNYCWITNTHGAIWAFHVPVIIVIITNVIVLIAVSIVVARASRKKDPNRCAFCALLQASFILVPTLGLTWILGFFVVGTDLYSTIVEWVFFLFTTLQGIAIFVIHCIVNTEVRVAFLRAIGCRQAARKQKSFFELKPRAALSSLASSAGQFTRRMSLGSRRGSLDPPVGTFPSAKNKEVNAYSLANALYKLEEESMEDSQMFSQSDNTPKKSHKTNKVTFIDEVDEISDTESSKGDKLVRELLQADDINMLHDIIYVEENEGNTSDTESFENMRAHIPPPPDFLGDNVQNLEEKELTLDKESDNEQSTLTTGSEVPLLNQDDNNTGNDMKMPENKKTDLNYENVSFLLEKKLAILQEERHLKPDDISTHENSTQDNITGVERGDNPLLDNTTQNQPFVESETSLDTYQIEPQTSTEDITGLSPQQTHDTQILDNYFEKLEEQLKQSFNTEHFIKENQSLELDSASVNTEKEYNNETIVTIMDTSIDTSVIPYIWSSEPSD